MSTRTERADRHPFGPADDTCHGRCAEMRDWFAFECRGLLVPEEAHELLDMLLNRLAEDGALSDATPADTPTATVGTLTLVRHLTDLHTHRDGHHRTVDTVEHNPPALPCPDVLTVLASRLQDRATPAGEPIRWHHRDGAPWGAVEVLHRRGEHDLACGLARLLRWCDTRAGHDEIHAWSLLSAGGAS